MRQRIILPGGIAMRQQCLGPVGGRAFGTKGFSAKLDP
jgi:hypothetical protein